MTKDRAARVVTLAIEACQRAGFSDDALTHGLRFKRAIDDERFIDPWSTPEFAHAVAFCRPAKSKAAGS